MPLLDEKTQSDVRELLSDMAGAAQMILITSSTNCPYCNETRELVEEVAGLSDLVSYQVLDKDDAAAEVEQYQVDKFPALVMLGAEDIDYGIRYYGIPSGYEFTSLLHDLKAVAAGPGSIELSEQTIDYLTRMAEPLHLQVFVTPTCPYCPRAVVLAHAMAIASDKVRADMVEATEFPALSQKYNVMGVPRTVINETNFVEGAVPEQMLMARIMEG